MTNNKQIKIPILARVEGEGALELEIKAKQIKKINLKIYEPPRLFEKFLENRSYDDVIDIVARICGICPVAYQMSAAQALEQVFQIKPSPWGRAMRRVYYCGEWIVSHAIHIHFLAAPDFLGFNSAHEMATKFPDEVRRGMRIHALGAELIGLFGSRAVNPVGACVGGFYGAPDPDEVKQLTNKVKAALADSEALIRWLATLDLPDSSHEFICVALRHPDEYPMNEGHIVNNKGLDITKEDFNKHFTETQVPYSTALQCSLDGKDYLVGPLARVNLNYHHLPQSIHDLLDALGLKFPSYNMFHSIIARAIEIHYSFIEALRILQDYQLPKTSKVEFKPIAGVGYGCTEAPRGLLWQHYHLNQQGLVTHANIVPPTSQNQYRIEQDLLQSLTAYGLDQSDTELRHYSEMIIRNYDPCISCSTHFLDLRIKRT